MEALPIDKFFGVGKVTAAKMKKLGLFTGADLKRLSEQELITQFGKQGKFFYMIVRGIDNREVQAHRETKSVGAEDTFSYDLESLTEMQQELDKLSVIVVGRLQRHQLKGRTITIKIKYHDFKQVTRSYSALKRFDDVQTIQLHARALLEGTDLSEKRIRLLGITISNFEDASETRAAPAQLSLNI